MSMESSTHCSEDAKGRERTIAELEDRIRVLENELRLKHGRAEESVQLMRYMVDQAQDDASLAGPDGRFYYVNDAKCRSLGYTREELLSMHVWDVDLDITKDRWAAAWQYIKKHGFKKLETRHRTKYGQVFMTEVSVTYFDFHGSEYISAFVRDITERKQVEEALKKSEELYRELVENANSIILRYDMRGNLTFFNEYAEKLFGFSEDEVLGRGVVGTIVPLVESTGRDLNDMMEDMKRCPERYHSNVNENECKNGERVWIAWTNKAIRDEHGKIVEILSVGNDITDRKRMEGALRESEEKLQLAVDGAQMGMWDWNIEADVLVWSDRCKKIVGIPPDAAVNYGVFLDSIHPDDQERINRMVKEALDNREDYDVEMRIPWHDGTVHWAACRGRGVYDKAGKAIRMIGMAMDITEHKRAVEALRVSEERLCRASRAGRIGLFEWNLDRGAAYLSPEAYELYKLDPGSMATYETWLATVHPDDCETVEHTITEARERASHMSGASTQIEFRVMHPDGAIIWLLATVTCNIEDGDLIARGAVRDITERKRVEDALKKSEESLARAQTVAHLANWELDVGTGLVRVSDEFYSIFNLEPDVPQEAYGEKIHTDDRAMVLESVHAAIYEGKPYSIDYRIIPRPGEVRHVHAEGETIRDRDGHPLSFFGTVQDITERKRADEALRESEERLCRASRAGRIGLYEWNEDRGTVYLSPEACVLFGCEPDCPETFEKFLARLHIDDRELFMHSSAEAREKVRTVSGVSAQREFRVLHKDGSVLWLEATATYNLEGGDIMVRGAVRDITERKRAEEELANAKAQAELYVDLMGHDINNFNQKALGYLELLEGTVVDGKLKEFVVKPIEAIDCSSRLIRNVQKLQRARSGGNHMEVLDLGELVEEVAGQFTSSPDKPVNITCHAVKGVRVRANELLRDVFVNLVGNAIKHSTGPACVNIRMVPEKKDGRRYCKVIIDDNGPGVSDDMKEKIFNRLSRGNTKAKGSGLGLYLVKSLVESYGGRVWAEDRVPGDHTQGARLVVLLPAVDK